MEAGEVSLQAEDPVVVENKEGNESSKVTLDEVTNESEAVSTQDEVLVPSLSASVDEPDVATHKVEAVTAELVHGASEDRENIVVEETEADAQGTNPAAPVHSAGDDVAPAKEETALESLALEEVERRNETAAVVEEGESHHATSEAPQPIESHVAPPEESSTVERESSRTEVPVSNQNVIQQVPSSLVESTGLAEEVLVPTEPVEVEEPVVLSVSVGEAEHSINDATPSLVEEHASLLEPVVADPTQDQAEPAPLETTFESEVHGIDVLGAVKDAGSPAEEGNTPAESSTSDKAGTPSVAGVPDSSDPVDDINPVGDAHSEKSGGTEEFVGDSIELEVRNSSRLTTSMLIVL